MSNGNFNKDVKATIRRQGATLAVDPDPIEIEVKGTIEWSCSDGDFVVVVHKRHGNGPLDQGRVLHGKKGGSVRATVKSDADQITYEYIVAACIGEEVFAEDPDVVVGPEGGE